MRIEESIFKTFDRDIYQTKKMTNKDEVFKEYTESMKLWKELTEYVSNQELSGKFKIHHSRSSYGYCVPKAFWTYFRYKDYVNYNTCIIVAINKEIVDIHLEWESKNSNKSVNTFEEHNQWINYINEWIIAKDIDVNNYKVWIDEEKTITLNDFFIMEKDEREKFINLSRNSNNKWLKCGLIYNKNELLDRDNIEKIISKNISDIEWIYNKTIENIEKKERADVKVSNKKEDSGSKERNFILYGPPGTGKTFNTTIAAVKLIEDDNSIGNLNDILQSTTYEEYEEIKGAYEDYKEKNQISMISFHQSYSYEEFVEGIKPNIIKLDNKDKEKQSKEELNKKDNEIQYIFNKGIFKSICLEALKEENKEKKFVLIIDEINRGNISQIFGELITLIEESKRVGNDEEIRVKLPYTGDDFGVPKNLFILGTMNTADRSIALMDTALRRRFNFIEMMPDPDKLDYIYESKTGADKFIINGISICEMLKVINTRIEVLYDREHTIGHAYFTELLSDTYLDENDVFNQQDQFIRLSFIFRNKIIPLLQEYFYDDWQKIRLILGDNQKNKEDNQFIKEENIDEKEIKRLFGKNVDLDFDDSKKKYVINEAAFINPEAYKGLYCIEAINKEDVENNE